jgi:hypothetical protein
MATDVPPVAPTLEHAFGIIHEQQQRLMSMEAQLAALRGPAAPDAVPHAPRLKLPAPPETDGRHPPPIIWSYKMEAYLHAEGYNLQSQPAAVLVAAAYLKGPALLWHLAHRRDVERGHKPDYVGYEEFKLAFITRFTPVDPAVTAREKLDRCRQTKSAYAYTAEFDSLIMELPNMDEADKLHKYIHGLKAQLQMHVQLQRPRTLAEAQDLAIRADTSLWTLGRGNSYRHSHRSSYMSSTATPMELDRLESRRWRSEPRATDDKTSDTLPRRKADQTAEGNVCWHCGQPGHYRRECRRYLEEQARNRAKPTSGRATSGGRRGN